MAQAALLMLDAVDASSARSWLKQGHKVYNATVQRLRQMAGFVDPQQAAKPDDVKSNRKSAFAKLKALGASPR